MNDIIKILRKMSPKLASKIMQLMLVIKAKGKNTPRAIALQSMPGWYRVRCGQYRIIFTHEGEDILIRKLSKRNVATYKKL